MWKPSLAVFCLLVGVALFGQQPRQAIAACGALPYTFTNNVSTVDANTTNSNNNHLQGCATQVDNTQIGAAGIYASQIIPTSTGQATFGGSQGYTFTMVVLGNAADESISGSGYVGEFVVAQPTAAPTAQPGNIGLGGYIMLKNAGTNTLCLGNDGSCAGISQPYIQADSAGTAGINFDVPTSSTNGFLYRVNNSSIAQITAAGLIISDAGTGANQFQWSCSAASTICDWAQNSSATIAGVSGGVGCFNNGTNNTANSFVCINGAGALGTAASLNAGTTVSGASQNACSSSSGFPCETTSTCTTASSTTCTATATVPAGSVCTAVGNLAAGGTGPILTWITTLVSTTLSMIIENGTSGSVAIGDNITCV